MSEVRRFNAFRSGGSVGLWESAEGEWVLYTDHVEALRQAEQRGRDELARQLWGGANAYEQGKRDALAAKHHDPGERCDGCLSFATEEAITAAVQRVEALPRMNWAAYRDHVIAAIKGES